MLRESTDAKARRFLIDGRVAVRFVQESRVEADVAGETGTWHVSFSRGAWRCDCPSRRRCSHLLAVASVTTRPPE